MYDMTYTYILTRFFFFRVVVRKSENLSTRAEEIDRDMGLCGSSVNLEMISDDADDDVDVPSGGWTVGTLEQKIIELVDLLSASTKKALSLKRAKKIKAAKRITNVATTARSDRMGFS